MAFKGPSTSETNYSGKAEDLRAEKQDKKSKFIDNEPPFDLNDINQAIGRSPLDSDNDYNSPKESEKILRPEKKTPKNEDIVGSDGNDMIDALNVKMDEERIARDKALLDIDDPYGFSDVISKILDDAKNNEDQKKINTIIDQCSAFIKQYRLVLNSHLSEEEEHKMVTEVFKNNIGKYIVYSSELDSDGNIIDKDKNKNALGKDEEMVAEKVEFNNDRARVRNAKPGTTRSRRINYGAGFESIRGGVVKVFNTLTGKKEVYKQRNEKL